MVIAYTDPHNHRPQLLMLSNGVLAMVTGRPNVNFYTTTDPKASQSLPIIYQSGATSRLEMCFTPGTKGARSQRSQPNPVSNPDFVIEKLNPHYFMIEPFPRPRVGVTSG